MGKTGSTLNGYDGEKLNGKRIMWADGGINALSGLL